VVWARWCREKFPPLPGLEPWIIQPVAHRYTNELSRLLGPEQCPFKHTCGTLPPSRPLYERKHHSHTCGKLQHFLSTYEIPTPFLIFICFSCIQKLYAPPVSTDFLSLFWLLDNCNQFAVQKRSMSTDVWLLGKGKDKVVPML
jgi:hypothetical protein